jgi:predicted RND superfamily exporter protein
MEGAGARRRTGARHARLEGRQGRRAGGAAQGAEGKPRAPRHRDRARCRHRAEKLDAYQTATAGTVAQTVEELRSLWRDSAIFIPLTVVIGLVLLWWVVGRVRPMIVGGLAMGTVVAVSVAGIVASGQPYTPITAMVPTLMAAYTTATLLHLYAAIQRARIALLSRRSASRARSLKPSCPGCSMC